MHNYVIALYIRLSVEDFKTESLSIPNQRLILREKAMSLPEWDNSEILEFIDMEHTPKNILLRAVLRKEGDAEGEKKKETGEQIRELIHFLNADPAIVRLLAPEL